MFLNQLLNFLSGIVYLILHVTGGGTFPKALSAVRERECLEKMRDGTPGEADAARRELIEHNLRLVAHIIKNVASGGTIFPGRKPRPAVLRFSGGFPSGFPLLYSPV